MWPLHQHGVNISRAVKWGILWHTSQADIQQMSEGMSTLNTFSNPDMWKQSVSVPVMTSDSTDMRNELWRACSCSSHNWHSIRVSCKLLCQRSSSIWGSNERPLCRSAVLYGSFESSLFDVDPNDGVVQALWVNISLKGSICCSCTFQLTAKC